MSVYVLYLATKIYLSLFSIYLYYFSHTEDLVSYEHAGPDGGVRFELHTVTGLFFVLTLKGGAVGFSMLRLRTC